MSVVEDLTCINCKKGVPAEESQFFDGVFVCKRCGVMAQRVYERGQKELQQLLLVFKETVRIALIEGRLHFGESAEPEVSKTDLLRTIVRLEEEKRSSHGARGRKPDLR